MKDSSSHIQPFVPFEINGQEYIIDNGGILHISVGKNKFDRGLISPDGTNWEEWRVWNMKNQIKDVDDEGVHDRD